jgi:hypothetical protein
LVFWQETLERLSGLSDGLKSSMLMTSVSTAAKRCIHQRSKVVRPASVGLRLLDGWALSLHHRAPSVAEGDPFDCAQGRLFPGVIHRLTNLLLLDYTITVNVDPIPIILDQAARLPLLRFSLPRSSSSVRAAISMCGHLR